MRRMPPIILVLLGVLLFGGCSYTSRVSGEGAFRSRGEAVREAWGAVGLARRAAIDAATADARRGLWLTLMEQNITWPGASQGAGFVAQLVVMDAAFASRLRSLVAELDPDGISEFPDGRVEVWLSLDRGRVARLTEGHGARLLASATESTRMGRAPSVAGD